MKDNNDNNYTFKLFSAVFMKVVIIYFVITIFLIYCLNTFAAFSCTFNSYKILLYVIISFIAFFYSNDMLWIP